MTEKIIDMDEKILLWIQEHMTADFLTPIMKVFTYSLNSGLLPIAITILLVCFKKTRKIGVLCACAIAATFLIDNIIIKNIVARVRPYEAVEGVSRLIAKQRDYSFPSGHSAAAFTFATVIFKKCSPKIGVPALVYAALVAFSRMYLGVHYPSDVLIGAVTGSLFAYIICLIYDKKISKAKTFNKE